MNFLLDTCAISGTIKPKPDAGYMDWLQDQQAGQLFISTISLGEPYLPAWKLRAHPWQAGL